MVYLGEGLFAFEEQEEIFSGHGSLANDALVGAGGDVRSDDGIGCLKERMIGGGGFNVEDVGTVASELASFEGFDDGFGLDQFAPAAVDEEGTGFELGEALVVDHLLGLRGQVGVEGDDIALAEEIGNLLNPLNSVGLGKFTGPINVVADDLHAKGMGTDGDLATDATKPDDPDRLAGNLVSGDPLPEALAGPEDVIDEFFLEGKEEHEDVLGDRGVVDAGGEGNRDAVLGGGGNIDLIDADAVFGNVLQAGEGLFDDGPGDGVVPAEEGIELAGGGEHLGFWKGATGGDDLGAGGGEEFVVRTGGVLVGGGGEEDAHGGWLGKRYELVCDWRVRKGGRVAGLDARIDPKASVDTQDLAGDELAGWAKEEVDGAADLICLAEAAHRGLGDDLLASFGEGAVGVEQEGAVLVANEEAWADRIHSQVGEAFFGEVGGHPAGEVVDSSLGIGVAENPGEGLSRGCRGKIDDGATGGRDHWFGEDEGGDQGALEVEFEDLIIISQIQIEDRFPWRNGSPGHVPSCSIDEAIDASELVEDGLANFLEPITVGHVAGEGGSVSGIAERAQGLGKFLFTAPEEDNLGLVFDKVTGNRSGESTGRAGNDNYLTR